MKIGIDFSSIKQDRWYEYLERFVFGGAITAATGLIAKRFGPEVAGLFLAFPAIFPATSTLVEKHQREKKEKAGMPGERSGRAVSSVDSAGAAMGTFGLVAFGVFVWRLLPQHSTWIVLVSATWIWLGVVVAVWMFRKSIRKRRKRIPAHS
jgi:MFS family permease